MSDPFADFLSALKDDPAAKHYFDSLPEHVRSAIAQRPGGVNSFESLCSYADNLTQGDR